MVSVFVPLDPSDEAPGLYRSMLGAVISTSLPLSTLAHSVIRSRPCIRVCLPSYSTARVVKPGSNVKPPTEAPNGALLLPLLASGRPSVVRYRTPASITTFDGGTYPGNVAGICHSSRQTVGLLSRTTGLIPSGAPATGASRRVRAACARSPARDQPARRAAAPCRDSSGR